MYKQTTEQQEYGKYKLPISEESKVKDYALRNGYKYKGIEDYLNNSILQEEYHKSTQRVPLTFQNGGTREPIYVTDPNDKRLQMYNDSLNSTKKYTYFPFGEELFSNEKPITKKRLNEYISEVGLFVGDNSMEKNPYPNILPVDYIDSLKNGDKRKFGYETALVYQKPVQPYLLSKERPKEQLETIDKREYVPQQTERQVVTNPYEGNGTFRRTRQQQESGRGQYTDYFDKKTGKKVGTYDTKNNKIATQKYQNGGSYIPTTEKGLWEVDGPVNVPTPTGRITMQGIDGPVLGIGNNTGQQIMMQPEKEYQFKGDTVVHEIPLYQNGTSKRVKLTF